MNIVDCNGCDGMVDRDNSEYCIVCNDTFCGACDFEKGISLWSESNLSSYYVCKQCLDNGLDEINDENMDDATFDKDEYNKAVVELNSRNKRRL